MDKIYCYPTTSILKNKLDIHNKGQLLMAETSLVVTVCTSFRKIPFAGALIMTIFVAFTTTFSRTYMIGPEKRGW